MLPTVAIILNLGVPIVGFRQSDGATPAFWLPPKGFDPRAVFALNETDIVACAYDGLIVCDVRRGKVKRRVSFDKWPCNFMASGDRSRLYHYNPSLLSVWDTQALQCIARFGHYEQREDGCFLVEEQAATAGKRVPLACWMDDDTGLAEQADGRLAILAFCEDKWNERKANPFRDTPWPPATGTFLIDPATWRIEHTAAIGKYPLPYTFASPASTLGRAAQKFLEQGARFIWPVGGMTASAVSQALDALAVRIAAAGFDGISIAGTLDIVFKVGERELREDKFSAELVLSGMTTVVPSLRRLLTAYLECADVSRGEVPQSEFDRGITTAPFGYLLRALLVLDKGSTDIYRRYLEMRDAGHETFTCLHITPTLLKTHGIKTIEDLRFAIHATLNASNSGQADWKKSGVIRAASKLVSGGDFVAMVHGELKQVWPDLELGNADDYDVFIAPLADALAATANWERDALDSLARHWPVGAVAGDA